jgi:predicted nucleotidyltransferase
MRESRAVIDEIAEILRAAHGCHAAIVYGSHARGDATSESDYDVAGFGEVDKEKRIAGKWRGAYVDLFIHPTAKLASPDASSVYLRGGTVLFEREDEATRFLQELGSLYARGPATLTSEEITLRRRWAWKMLDRIARDDTEAHYRRTWLLMVLLEDWFQLRGRWYEGPKASLAWLAAQDAQTHSAFAQALQPGSSTRDVERLVQVVAGPRADTMADGELAPRKA